MTRCYTPTARACVFRGEGDTVATRTNFIANHKARVIVRLNQKLLLHAFFVVTKLDLNPEPVLGTTNKKKARLLASRDNPKNVGRKRIVQTVVLSITNNETLTPFEIH